MMRLHATLSVCLAVVSAQDPADGWMAYAVGTVPKGTKRITALNMTWTVGAAPKHSFAFFSPWFGMDPADNLNLVQPVNPWTGSSWQMYTEYFQWSPEHNSNSKSYTVSSGDTLHGSIVYEPASDAYMVRQELVEAKTGIRQESVQFVPCQSGKTYTLPYVVYEKLTACSNYPPDGIVTFRNISIECDGVECTSDVKWAPMVKDPNCNMMAHVDSAKNEISITWDTSMTSKYDNYTEAQLLELNSQAGWGSNIAAARRSAP